MATYAAADGSTREFDLNQALRFASVKEYETGRDVFGPRFTWIPGGEQVARVDDGTWVWMDSGNTSGRSEPWREITLGDAERWFGRQRWTFRWRGPVGAFGVEHRSIGVPTELLEDLRRDAEQPATAPEPAPSAVVSASPCKATLNLNGPAAPPILNGKAKDRLTAAQYDVLRTLLDAGEDGLSGDRLAQRSKHEGAVNILKRLAKSDPDWARVIQLPGRAGLKYRLLVDVQNCPDLYGETYREV